jgi:hypothetical protein
MATVMLFHVTIFDFVIGVLSDSFLNDEASFWTNWVDFLWIAATVLIVSFWRSISKEKAELRERSARNPAAGND